MIEPEYIEELLKEKDLETLQDFIEAKILMEASKKMFAKPLFLQAAEVPAT